MNSNANDTSSRSVASKPRFQYAVL